MIASRLVATVIRRRVIKHGQPRLMLKWRIAIIQSTIIQSTNIQSTNARNHQGLRNNQAMGNKLSHG